MKLTIEVDAGIDEPERVAQIVYDALRAEYKNVEKPSVEDYELDELDNDPIWTLRNLALEAEDEERASVHLDVLRRCVEHCALEVEEQKAVMFELTLDALTTRARTLSAEEAFSKLFSTRCILDNCELLLLTD